MNLDNTAMRPTQIVLATTNVGKIKEFNQLLAPITCIAAPKNADPIAETGTTFIENALIKARAVSVGGNQPTLADDSGLVVPLLHGEPGIKSARFAEDNLSTLDNLNYLLQRLKPIPVEKRRAYFYCALALMTHPLDPTPIIAIGTLHGILLDAPRGTHGFGYDPIFYLPALNCTLAELTLPEKNKHSHRAHAARALLNQLEN